MLSFPPATPAVPSRHQRMDGAARVVFGARGLRDLAQKAPCRLLFPDDAPGSFPLAVSLTTSGGLTGGDSVTLDIGVEPDACGTVTTQAAEKLYRSLPEDPPVRMTTRIAVGAGGRCEWLGQEAILFDRSGLRRELHVDLAEGAALLAVETLVLGRTAMGEEWTTGTLHDAWRIRREGRLVWADALHMAGDVAGLAARPFGLGGARALATLLYAGADAEAHLDLARALAAPEVAQGQAAGGATCLDHLLILRLLDADAAALRGRVMRAVGALRAAVFGLPSTLPALWRC